MPTSRSATRRRCHHEGRSFAAVTITARQSRGVIATASISMHAVEGGPEHQDDRRRARGARSRTRDRARPDPLGDAGGRRPQRHDDRPAAVRVLDAHPRGRARTGAGTRGLRHRPDADRYRAAADRRRQVSAERARRSPPRSPRTPCGSIGRSAPTIGCCCASTARCWRTVDASAAVTCSPRTASWSPHTARRPSSASQNHNEKPILLSGEYKLPETSLCVDTIESPMPEL